MALDLKNMTSLLKSFPSMPGAAVKLLALIDDPEISVDRIEKILRQDAGLTANLLKLANSAYFGIPSKIGSVRRAVLLLGLKRLIQMVIASCVSAIMDKPVPGYDLPPGELWRHSLAVTVAAEGLVKELKIEAAEEVFTAALLHDVGKLVLGEFVADDINKIDNLLSPEVAFETAEDMVLGTNHADIGARILNQWSLPPGIVNAVRWHHDPDSADHSDLMLDIVHVANVLCLMIGIGVGRDGLQHQPSAAVIDRLGLAPEHLEKVASQTLQWVEELSVVIGNN
jgi:putative nucleotidyltransferase with HDIG domain